MKTIDKDPQRSATIGKEMIRDDHQGSTTIAGGYSDMHADVFTFADRCRS